MTTRSVAEIGRSVISQLAEERPDIKIKRIMGTRVGAMRLARVYFEDGAFVQVPLLPLKTTAGFLISDLAAKISASRKLAN